MTAYRMLYLSFACIMLASIWLTGFDKVHWLLYVPVAFVGFAGLSGFCINIMVLEKDGLSGATRLQTGDGRGR